MIDARRGLAAAVRAAVPSASPELIDAFASVPRERFLPPGPWHVRDMNGARVTEDADCRHVYADASIAVDPGRDLFNGQPSTVAHWLAAVRVAPGDSVLHIGCGSGYYTAILAELTGPSGRVTAIDVDASLAAAAGAHLADWPWVQVHHGDGTTDLPSDTQVTVVHAGASHVRQEWLAASAGGARLLVPLTVAMPAMGATLGKGLTFAFARDPHGWRATALSFIAIYSMVSARDDAAAALLGQAMQRGGWDRVRRLRTDSHKADATCWCHVDGACLSATETAVT